MTPLNLTVSDRARRLLAEMLANSDLLDAMPALMWSSTNKEAERWTIAMYSRRRAEELDRMYRCIGQHAIFQTEFGALCIPQSQLIADLQEKCLDIVGTTVVVG